eukprot:TRINITY_DN6329_c0_g1::TRINITY_DN6329_c0_g1_i1::g.576::m.576 TRINITY_DN6329_c0_g1::TRINITY_DN6329_c0_g1_i1::g.576  ORF type:complete len:180 (-),score=13.60,sp/H2QL32/PDE9A_PANTR/32.43/2e-12,PDEase_I/PF00233.14/1.3e-19 TRINITY_DN6329_c0_g1_i1:295-834(-)
MHHCSALFFVLAEDENNILERLEDSEWRQLRKLVIQLILATELSRHSDIVDQFEREVKPQLEPQNPKHREMILKLILKSADIGILTEPWDLFRAWAEALHLEIWAMDSTTTKERFCLGQHKFMKNTRSLFEGMASLFEWYKPGLDRLDENTKKWEEEYVNEAVTYRDQVETWVLTTAAC